VCFPKARVRVREEGLSGYSPQRLRRLRLVGPILHSCHLLVSRMPPKGKLNLHQRLEADKEDPTLVWDLQETGDPRDQRLDGPPCCGAHCVDQHNCRIRNQHALILKCRKCQVRLLYVPVRGSSGDTRKPTPLREMAGSSSKTPAPRGKGCGPKGKAKAKAVPRTRHTDGPHWENFLIGTPQDSEAEAQESVSETESTSAGRPVWDGDPDTWEAFQQEVNDYLEAKRTATSSPPVWDGNPDTWEEYQQVTQEWVDTQRERLSMSTSSSRRR